MLKRKLRWFVSDISGLFIDLKHGFKETAKWLVIFALAFVLFTILLPLI